LSSSLLTQAGLWLCLWLCLSPFPQPLHPASSPFLACNCSWHLLTCSAHVQISRLCPRSQDVRLPVPLPCIFHLSAPSMLPPSLSQSYSLPAHPTRQPRGNLPSVPILGFRPCGRSALRRSSRSPLLPWLRPQHIRSHNHSPLLLPPNFRPVGPATSWGGTGALRYSQPNPTIVKRPVRACRSLG
jgi:hypothetical protein